MDKNKQTPKKRIDAIRFPEPRREAIEELRVTEERSMNSMVNTLVSEALKARGIKVK